MIVSIARAVELDLPRGWREMPPTSVLADDRWIFEWIEESNAPASCRAQLAADLRIAASFLRTRADERTWLLVTDPDDFSVVHGLASIDVQSATAATDEAAAAVFAAIPVDEGGAVNWCRTVTPAVVGGFPAEVAHDIAVAEFPSAADVVERAIVTVFPDEAVQAVRLELDVHSLAVYDDVVAVALAALADIRFVDVD